MTKEEFLERYGKRWDLTVEWTTGGVSGGNCYGDSPDSAVDPDPEPDLEVLDEILMDLTPTATFMEFRRIMKDPDIIARREWEDREYYGNYYCKASKTLNLEALWKYIDIMINIPDPHVRVSHYKLMEN